MKALPDIASIASAPAEVAVFDPCSHGGGVIYILSENYKSIVERIDAWIFGRLDFCAVGQRGYFVPAVRCQLFQPSNCLTLINTARLNY